MRYDKSTRACFAAKPYARFSMRFTKSRQEAVRLLGIREELRSRHPSTLPISGR
jgi:hypothetical protein